MTKYMVCSYEGSRVIKHIEACISIKDGVAIFYNSYSHFETDIIAVFNTREVFIVEED